ncbi:MAG: hypothetical protein AB4040_18235 [Synechococcus sp.]
MRGAKIPIPAASGRGITEFSLRDALPLVVIVASHGESDPVEIDFDAYPGVKDCMGRLSDRPAFEQSTRALRAIGQSS